MYSPVPPTTSGSLPCACLLYTSIKILFALFTALLVVVLGYLCIQIYTIFHRTYKTETAIAYTLSLIHIYSQSKGLLSGMLCGSLLSESCATVEIMAYYNFCLLYTSYNAITPEAVKAMIEELKQQGMPVNGFLDKTQIGRAHV